MLLNVCSVALLLLKMFNGKTPFVLESLLLRHNSVPAFYNLVKRETLKVDVDWD